MNEDFTQWFTHAFGVTPLLVLAAFLFFAFLWAVTSLVQSKEKKK